VITLALKKSLIYAFVLAAFSVFAFNVQAQTDNGGMSSAEVERIIGAFTAKESEFRRALNAYSFKRDALIQALGMGGQVIGEYHRVSTFTFDDQGNRYEKINFFPMSTMGQSVTQEDIEDLGGIKPFALDPSRVAEYNIKYVGKEKIDDLNLYVFDIAPKVMPKPKNPKDRMFQGRIWVDDQDLQIVKTRGKGVPETKKNKFPTVETYREHIDGRYWFPTYSYADEELIFEDGGSLHVRIKVRYTDFAVARGTLKVVTEVGETENPTAVPSKGVAKPVESGVLNARASTLAKAKYPEEARRLRVSGKVTVRVVVDETGKVISAVATDGPIPLRAAAMDAARLTTFEPTVQDGVTVKIAGVLVFEFVP
jgi:TonB family protein